MVVAARAVVVVVVSVDSCDSGLVSVAVGSVDVEVDGVASVAVGVGWVVEGVYSSANRVLSEFATASTISGKVTLRDLSLRHASCIPDLILVGKLFLGYGSAVEDAPHQIHWRSLAHLSGGLLFRRRDGEAGSVLSIP